jgi:hypothetical protein
VNDGMRRRSFNALRKSLDMIHVKGGSMRMEFNCAVTRLCLLAGIVGIALIGCSDSDKPSSAASSAPQQTYPVIEGFFAENHEIVPGSSTTLTALFRNGTASIDQGIGSVTNGTPVTISPTETTTYNLSVSGGGKTEARSLVVTMTKPVAAQSKLGTFSKTGSLSASRTQHTATLLLNGKVLIAGGWGKDDCDSDRKYGCMSTRTTAELYDPQNGSFIETGRLISARTEHTATILPSGKVLVVGGRKSYSEVIASAELYDPVTGKFKAAGSLITARSSHTATLLPNGKVLIAGGTGSNENGALASAELYDSASGKFSKAGSLTTARFVHTATLLPNGKVLLAGGAGKVTNSILASAELYDLQSDTFSNTGALITARVDNTATLLKDGKVLLVGGHENSSAEIYDPTSGLSREVGRLAAPRLCHTATLLPNGMVLIVGGTDGRSGATSSVELYEPSTATFIPIDSLYPARRWHTATPLPDGKVLIVAGDDYDYVHPEVALYAPSPIDTSASASPHEENNTSITTTLPNDAAKNR